MPLTNEDLQAIDARIEERLGPIRVQREDHEALKQAVVQLQVEVAHLVKAMEEQSRRMEEGFARLWEALELQGQRMDEQGRRIEEQGRRIEEQGRRMEAGFAQLRAELREEGNRWGQRLDEQGRRMEEGFAQLRSEIGALTEAYGLDLEDVGQYVIPRYLVQEEGLELDVLEPHHLQTAAGEVEIDHFGQARKEDWTCYVVGETKSRVHLGELKALIERNRRLGAELDHPVLPVLFARRIHPQALALARTEGFIIIPWNYQYSERCSGAA